MRKLLFLFVTIIFLFSGWQTDAGERWQLIMTNQIAKHYFDVDSFRIVENENRTRINLDVWIKVCYNDEGKKTYLDSLRRADISTVGYENFNYTVNHLIFDEGRVCLLGIYDYTADGVILRCFDAPVKRWMDIIPGSIIEIWYDQVLTYAIANLKTVTDKNA